MKRAQQDLVRVSDEAAAWLLRLQEEDSPQARAEFDQWIRRGPGHLEEFLFAQMMFSELDRLDPSFDFGTFDGNESVVEFPQSSADPAARREPSKDSRRWTWISAIAASLMLAIGLLVAAWPLGLKVYSTKIGSQEAIKLEDGSVIHLNTGSRAQVDFSRDLREVRLLEGEALFTVAHDPGRPFIVVTDSARVRAIGTQFNVYRSGANQTKVSVIEGVVQVSVPHRVAAELTARDEVIRLASGDEAAIVGARLVKMAAPDVERAVAWRTRRLVFPGNPIAEVAEEFNRYSARQIRVEGEAIRSRQMTGVFDADDPSTMIRFLSRDPNVEVIASETEILIRPRSSPEP